MDIKSFGGEFKLIEEITKNFKNYSQQLVKGVGDDCAVINQGNKYLIITSDSLVEGDHFRSKWATPKQIGKKSAEVNVSDIAAMAGKPQYLLCNLILDENTDISWVKGVYSGIKEVCDKYKITLIGGDTTHGKVKAISLTAIGDAYKKNICFRSGACENNLICVTGNLGGSWAGLEMLRANKKLSPVISKRHLEPIARLKDSWIIAKYATSMIDISDGLASEIRHICEQSKKGAQIYKKDIPITKETFSTAKILKKDAYSWALSGGEDFELVFTINLRDEKPLRKIFQDFSIVGKILPIEKGLHLIDGKEKIKLPEGYNHFNL